MQTAPLQPSHQQKMHQTRVLPGRGVASYPLQHSPPNFQHLPHTQSGSLHTNQTNQLPLRHRRALQLKKLQRRHLHPLLLDFHRGLHGRDTHGRVPSHDRAHLVYRPEQNHRRRSAPNLHCDPCGSSAGCDLLCHTCGTSAPWPTVFFLGAPLSARRTSTAVFMPRHVHQDPSLSSERLLPCFLARPPASQSVLHCCTLQVRLPPSSGLICCILQQLPNSSAKLLQQSSENYLDIVASARRSGQEDFRRGTPPVSLASCAISPFFIACIITE